MFGSAPFGGARWQPVPARRIGQASQASSIMVVVTRDGKPEPGVPVEAMFQNGNVREGRTDMAGKAVVPFGPPEHGQTVIRITPPAGVQDLGEGTAQGVTASGTPSTVTFALMSTPAEAAAPSPLIGIALAIGLLSLATFGMGGGR